MRVQAARVVQARVQAPVTALGQGRAVARVMRVRVVRAQEALAPAGVQGRATAALVVVLDPATMQEEEQESAAPERVGLEPGALDPVGRVGPGQAQALVPPAIPELSG